MNEIGFIIAAIISATTIKAGIRVDREYERGVMFRLGRFQKIQGPGLYFTIPGIDQKIQVDVRTKTVDIPPQEAVTADSVTIRINGVLYYRIIDPMKAINRVEDYKNAVAQAAMTTLRNVVGQNNLNSVNCLHRVDYSIIENTINPNRHTISSNRFLWWDINSFSPNIYLNLLIDTGDGKV